MMYYNSIRHKPDSRGRLVIPKNIREVFELEDCLVEFFTENDLICIRKVNAEDNAHRRKRNRGTSHCNYCLCSSCTGFGCPWVPKVYRYGWSINQRPAERCRLCLKKSMERVHDCDFYTSRKRKKFYYKRKAKQPSRHDIVMEEFAELKKLLKR